MNDSSIHKRISQEVFMPLVHRPGEAQVDFGFAVAKLAGVLRKIAFFVMVLPHSDAFFVMAFVQYALTVRDFSLNQVSA